MRIPVHRALFPARLAWLGWVLFLSLLVGIVHGEGSKPILIKLLTEQVPEKSLAGVSLAQWQSRLKKGEFTSEQVAKVVREVLRRQVDADMRWDWEWGDFVEQVRRQGELADDLWREYLFGAVQLKIAVPTTTKRSEGLMISVFRNCPRAGSHAPACSAPGRREEDVSGIPVKSHDAGKEEELIEPSGQGIGTGDTEVLAQDCYASLKPGPQTFHYRQTVQVFDIMASAGAPKPFGERIIEATLPWKLLEENQRPPLPATKADESMRPAIQKALHVNYALRDQRDATLVQLSIGASHPLVDMGFNLSLQSNGESWPLGPVAWKKGQMGGWSFDVDLPEGLTYVNAVLVPSAEAAAILADKDRFKLMNLDTIWTGPQIVLPGIPIQSQQISMRPIPPPQGREALDQALEQWDPSDPVVQQLKVDGFTSAAQACLEQQAKEQPNNAAARFHLGCIMVARGDLDGAMKALIAARQLQPQPPLQTQIQRQLRRICAMWLYGAENQEAAAMAALGGAYEHGWGVKADVQECKRWYRNASNAGDAGAMCLLASLYEHEAGATVHTDKAHEWYRAQTLEWYLKSAGSNNEEARRWLSAHNN